MTTQRQIAANQRNALKSTGPRTQEGKAIVCHNAVKHGILSQEIPIDEKESLSFGEFCSCLYIQLNPVGDFEHFIADRIISCAWRLHRVIHIETAFFRSEFNSRYNISNERSIKDAFAGSAKERMAVLSRYETAIEKSLYKAILELTRLQSMRQQSLADDFIVNPQANGIGFVSQKLEKAEIGGNSVDNIL